MKVTDVLDFDVVYTADGYPGVAWRLIKWETERYWVGPDDLDEVLTGMVIAHMVGDDRKFVLDPDDLAPIRPGGYCLECGAVGCGWHTNGEEDE